MQKAEELKIDDNQMNKMVSTLTKRKYHVSGKVLKQAFLTMSERIHQTKKRAGIVGAGEIAKQMYFQDKDDKSLKRQESAVDPSHHQRNPSIPPLVHATTSAGISQAPNILGSSTTPLPYRTLAAQSSADISPRPMRLHSLGENDEGSLANADSVASSPIHPNHLSRLPRSGAGTSGWSDSRTRSLRDRTADLANIVPTIRISAKLSTKLSAKLFLPSMTDFENKGVPNPAPAPVLSPKSALSPVSSTPAVLPLASETNAVQDEKIRNLEAQLRTTQMIEYALGYLTLALFVHFLKNSISRMFV